MKWSKLGLKMDKWFIKLVKSAVDDGLVQERATLCNELQNKIDESWVHSAANGTSTGTSRLGHWITAQWFFYHYKVVGLQKVS